MRADADCLSVRLIRKGEYEKTLKDIKIGETAVVKRLNGEGAVKRRIMDMGITKGTSVYVRKVAPLGDPYRSDGERI